MIRPERNTSTLLINESPLQVLPSLAVAIGLNEAIILQQVHYWLQRSTNERANRSMWSAPVRACRPDSMALIVVCGTPLAFDNSSCVQPRNVRNWYTRAPNPLTAGMSLPS